MLDDFCARYSAAHLSVGALSNVTDDGELALPSHEEGGKRQEFPSSISNAVSPNAK
jgi:hypothetical protein